MSRRPRHRGPKVPLDLGPVRMAIRLQSQPRLDDAPPWEPGVGLLADLAAAHQKGWKSVWTLKFGEASLGLRFPDHLGLLEEFWVFLIELVDVGHGEWSLYDGDQELTMEAQVFGPDVQLEFTSDGGRPRFGGRALPGRATVRLRALASEGVALLRQFVTESCRMDPSLRERPDLVAFLEDGGAVLEAVASLPGTFKERGRPGAPA